MFEKLIPIAAKYEDIEFRLSLPETAADPSVYTAHQAFEAFFKA